MKITVLLGNGFDVSLGIKSSYGDFYKWYYDKPTDIKHIQDFRNAIKEDILSDIPDDEKTWADFELGMGKYTENFTKETVGQFLECLDDAQENIRKYLLEQESLFDITQCTDKSIAALKKSIWNFYDEITDREKAEIKSMLDNIAGQDREISFITFNYTYTLERIFKVIPEDVLAKWQHSNREYAYKLNRNVLHVHGTTESFPVLGVNDESQIANKELLDTPQFKEMLVKAQNVHALGKLWHNQAEEEISNSRVVCILGMSLGATDAKWWRKLVQWLKADVHRHIVLYWYEKNPPNGISTVKQLRAVDGAKNKLLSYTEKLSTNEVSTLKNRIHVVINTSKYLRLEKKPKKEELTLQGMTELVTVLNKAAKEVPIETIQQAEELAKNFEELAGSLPLG